MLSGIIKCLFFTVLGGFIAFVGDQVGKKFGKKRVTLFHLRPRYTSMIFTVVFGMLISLVTLLLLTVISKDARTALFGMEKLEAERQKLRREITQLAQVTTLGQVVFHLNQPIVLGVVQGGGAAENMKEEISKLLAKANQVAIARGNELRRFRNLPLLDSKETVVVHTQEAYNEAVEYLTRTKKGLVVIIYSVRNVFLRDKVVAGFDFVDNRKVFDKAQVVTSLVIDGKSSREEILVSLFALLSQLQNSAMQAGMIPDPLTNNFGGNVMVATLLDKSDRIRRFSAPVTVKVIANEEIYTVGPLDVRFELEPRG